MNPNLNQNQNQKQNQTQNIYKYLSQKETFAYDMKRTLFKLRMMKKDLDDIFKMPLVVNLVQRCKNNFNKYKPYFSEWQNSHCLTYAALIVPPTNFEIENELDLFDYLPFWEPKELTRKLNDVTNYKYGLGFPQNPESLSEIAIKELAFNTQTERFKVCSGSKTIGEDESWEESYEIMTHIVCCRFPRMDSPFYFCRGINPVENYYILAKILSNLPGYDDSIIEIPYKFKDSLEVLTHYQQLYLPMLDFNRIEKQPSIILKDILKECFALGEHLDYYDTHISCSNNNGVVRDVFGQVGDPTPMIPVGTVEEEAQVAEETRELIEEQTVESAHGTTIESGVVEPEEATFTEAVQKYDYLYETFSDEKHTKDDQTDRFMTLAPITINPTIARGQVFHRIAMPREAILQNFNSPQVHNLLLYEYASVQIRIKVEMNLNKLQQVAFFVGAYIHYEERDRKSEIETLSCISQMPHILLGGAQSSSGTLVVPFQHFLGKFAAGVNTFSPENLFFHLLFVMASPLAIGSGGSPNVDIMTTVKFEHMQHYGTRSRFMIYPEQPCQVVQGQMFKSLFASVVNQFVGNLSDKSKDLIDQVESKVVSKLGIKEGDKPRKLTNTSIIPKTVTNIASGDGPMECESFRLNIAGSTPHVTDFYGDHRYFNYEQLGRTWGLINMFSIPVTAAPGTKLFEMRVGPCCTPRYNTGNILEDSTSTWCPLDNIADDFQMWRGDIELGFHFVMNGLATCRLRAAFEPGVTTIDPCFRNNVTYNIWDIAAELETREKRTFIIPYQQMMHMMPHNRRAGLDNIEQYIAGAFAIFVENRLVAPDTVPNFIECMVFMRAAKNFELAIPTQCRTEFTTEESATRTHFDCHINWNVFGRTWLIEFSQGGVVFQVFGFDVPLDQTAGQIILTPDRPVRAGGGPLVENQILLIFQGTTLQVRTAGDFGTNTALIHDIHFTLYANSVASNMWSLSRSWVTRTVIGEVGDNRLANGKPLDKLPQACKMAPLLTGEYHMNLQNVLKRNEFFHQMDINCPNSSEWATVARIPVTFGASTYREFQSIDQRRNKITKYSNAFRFSRGSLNYTLSFVSSLDNTVKGLYRIIHAPLEDPVFDPEEQKSVIYTPFSGQAEIHGSISVNPFIVMHIPFYNPAQAALNSSYLYVDHLITRMTNSLGNIHVQYRGPAQNMTLTVGRGLGDDVAMYGFNGFPQRDIQDVIQYPQYEGGQRVIRDPNTYRFNKLKQCGDIEENPGPIFSMFDRSTNDSIRRATDGIEELVNLVNRSIKGTEIASKTVITALQMMNVYANPTKQNVCISIATIILSWGIISFSVLTKLVASIGDLYDRFVDKKVVGEAGMDDIFTIIINHFGLNQIEREKSNWVDYFAKIFKYSATSNERITIFTTSLLTTLKKCLHWCMSKICPEYSLSYLLNNDLTKIQKWYEAAWLYTDPIYEKDITSDPEKCRFVKRLCDEGVKFQNVFRDSKRSDLPIDDVNRMMTKLIKIRDIIARTKSQANVKYEPFIIWIYGSTSIGKSYIVKEAIKPCLIKMNIRYAGDPIYCRTSGNQYWNNYDFQPAVVYDDFAQITNPDVNDFAEMFQLKTSAKFNPPQAAIEDKHIFANPYIVACCSNSAFPRDNTVKDTHAFWRRRDCFIAVRATAASQHCGDHESMMLNCRNCFNLNEKLIEEGKHVEFFFHGVMEKEKTDRQLYSGKSYDVNGFIAELERRSMEYHISEKAKYDKQLDDLFFLSDASYSARELGLPTIRAPERNMMPDANLRNVMDNYDPIGEELPKIEDIIQQVAPVLGGEIPQGEMFWSRKAKPYLYHPEFVKQEEGFGCKHMLIRLGNAHEPTTYAIKVHKLRNGTDVFCGEWCFGPLDNREYMMEETCEGPCMFKDREYYENFVKAVWNASAEVPILIMDTGEPGEVDPNGAEVNEVAQALPESNAQTIMEEFIRANEYRRGTELYGGPSWLRNVLFDPNPDIPALERPENFDTEPIDFIAEYRDLGVQASIAYHKPIVDMYLETVAKTIEAAHKENIGMFWLKRLQPITIEVRKLGNEVLRKFEEFNPDNWLVKLNEVYEHLSKMRRLAEICNRLYISIGTKIWRRTYHRVMFLRGVYLDNISGDKQSIWARVRESFTTRLNLAREVCGYVLKEHRATIIAGALRLITAFLMLYGTYRLIKRFWRTYVSPHYKNPEGEIMASSDERTSKIAKLRSKATKYFNKSVVVQKQNHHDIFSIIKRNTIYIEHNDIKIHVQMIGGLYGITQSHSAFTIASNIGGVPTTVKVIFCAGTASREINFSEISRYYVPDSDICIFKFPTTFPAFKALHHHFVTVEQLKDVSRTVTLLQYQPDGSETKVENMAIESFCAPLNYASFKEVNHIGWTYAKHESGLCGTVLFDENLGKIIGMHVAGGGTMNVGYGVALTKDELLVMYSDTDIKNVKENTLARRATVTINGECRMAPIPGTLSLGPVEPTTHPIKTALRLSPMYGVLTTDPIRTPALLTDARTSPLGWDVVHRSASVQIPHRIFPKLHVDKISDYMVNKYVSLVLPKTVVYSRRPVEQAVFGNENVKDFNSLYLSTSVGYPLSLKYHSKRELIDPDNKTISPIVMELINTNRNLRLSGVMPETIFQTCMKDEKLPFEKCHTPRLINASPIEFTITSRQYFMDFNLALMNNKMRIPCCVGISPMSMDWSMIRSKLIEKGSNICVGDFKKFGPRLDNNFINNVKKVINEWYRRNAQHCRTLKEDQRMRNLLFMELMNSRQVAGDLLYQVLCGSPSGYTGTVIINSLCAEQYVLAAWLGVMEPHNYGLHDFDKYVQLFTYGDDIIFSVDDNVRELFNNQTISNYLKNFEVGYTDVIKDGAIRKWCSIEDATFLKCSFTEYEKDKRFCVSSLPKPLIEDALNWYRNTQFIDEIMKQTCTSVCIQAFGHGHEYFSQIRNKILQYWQNKNEHVQLPTYDEIARDIYGFWKY